MVHGQVIPGCAESTRTQKQKEVLFLTEVLPSVYFLGPSAYPKNIKGVTHKVDGQLSLTWEVSRFYF